MAQHSISRPFESGYLCPACNLPFKGTQVIEVGEVNLETGKADVKLRGVKVSHDCVPPSPRSADYEGGVCHCSLIRSPHYKSAHK